MMLSSSSSSMGRIMERLLGRRLSPEDGLPADVITEAETKLGEPIPEPLRSLYKIAGNLPPFMSSFQRFAKPAEIYRQGELLMFLEENQGVCRWGVNRAGAVFQCQDDNECHALCLTLEQFLEIILYYQIAQGGAFTYTVALSPEDLRDLLKQDGWHLTVNNEGLVVYARESHVIWYFVDKNGVPVNDFVVLSGLKKPPRSWITRYALVDL